MEYDRYQHNHWIYLVALFGLILGLLCISIAIYILPYALFNWIYGLPLYFFYVVNAIKDNFRMTDSEAAWAICGGFMITGLLCLLFADIISNRIDNNLLDIKKQTVMAPPKPKKRSGEGFRTGLIIFTVIVLALFLIKVFEWGISSY